MISVSEAQQRILSHFSQLEAISLPIDATTGRVLARDVISNTYLPPFDNSSVDGFAVYFQDVANANPDFPTTLKVTSDIPAGSSTFVPIQSGECARIMTGAPIPPGSDAVVMLEETDSNQNPAGTNAPQSVSIFRQVGKDDNIRRRGSDITPGKSILFARAKLRPQDIGVLAMLGISHVEVTRKPRVVIFSSGDELLAVDQPLRPGSIHDSNSVMLTALCIRENCEVSHLGIAADRYESVEEILNQAAEIQPDIIISSAGVSVGAYDFVKNVVESSGNLNFWKVNMRPGKPLAFGHYKGIRFFGLPGNPVSSFVSFLLFVQPALRQLSGTEINAGTRVKVVLLEQVESDGRESYLRAIVTREGSRVSARLAGHQGSSNLLSLVQANALLIIPSGVKSCPPGSEVEAWILEN